MFDLCRQVLRGNHAISEEIHQAAVNKLGIDAAVEPAVTIGYVLMMSLANALEIPVTIDDSKPALYYRPYSLGIAFGPTSERTALAPRNIFGGDATCRIGSALPQAFIG